MAKKTNSGSYLKKHRTALIAVLILLIASSIGLYFINQSVNANVATGCTLSKPTAITGSINGYGGSYNGWAVNVLIGIDLENSDGKRVRTDGSILPANSPYSYIDKVNEYLWPPGSVDDWWDRTYGESYEDGDGVLCVSSKVKTAWFELYPKKVSGKTDKTHFGGANDQRMTIKAGATNRINLRLPTAFSDGGNTGDVNGYARYKKKPIDPSNLQFRVFPYDRGSTCGVQGFSASSDTERIENNATYYLIKNLAAGQCGNLKQKYFIYAYCKNSACGKPSVSVKKLVPVSKGSRPRVDISFD